MKKNIFIIVFVLIVIVLIYTFNRFINKNYMEEKKVVDDIVNICRRYRLEGSGGEAFPIENINDRYYYVIIYDEANVYNVTSDSGCTPSVIYIQVTSPEIKFGDKEVSIGMEKDKIQRIFRHSKRTDHYLEDSVYVMDEQKNVSEQHIDAFYNDTYGTNLGFIYDDNDRVKYIYVGFGL